MKSAHALETQRATEPKGIEAKTPSAQKSKMQQALKSQWAIEPKGIKAKTPSAPK
jgi:hypothetical protein